MVFLTSEKWFPIKQQHIRTKYTIVYLETPRKHHQSLQTLNFDHISYITRHNSNSIEAHKLMCLWSFWVLKKDFSIKKYYIEIDCYNSLAENTKKSSPVTKTLILFIFHIYPPIIARVLKLISKWVCGMFWLLKNNFPSSNNILKLNVTIVLLETPRNHHQSLQTIIYDHISSP